MKKNPNCEISVVKKCNKIKVAFFMIWGKKIQKKKNRKSNTTEL